MNRDWRLAVTAAAMLLGARAANGQQVGTHQVRFDRQIRTAAALEARAPHSNAAVSAPVDARHSNAPAIGAVVGAVALPAAAYLIFHDRDSGNVSTGGLVLIAAVGALLGYMVGLAVRGH